MNKLTKELKERFWASGYRYFLLKGMRRIEQDISGVYVIRPVRTVNGMHDGFVDIRDSIITSVLNNENERVRLLVENAWA